MDIDQKIIYMWAFCFSVLVFSPLVEGGCQDDIFQKPGALECFMPLAKLFTNSMGTNETDGTENGQAIFQTMCSPEGKAAFKCVFEFLRECPDLLTQGSDSPLSALGQIEGFNKNTFLNEGALDATCALLVGPCSKVQECFITPDDIGRMKRQEAPSFMNNYLMFMSQITMMCGPIKQQMDCMIKALENCPKSVESLIAAQFEAGMNISMGGQSRGIVSFQDTKSFVQNECSKLPSDETCLKNAFVSQTLAACDKAVSVTYTKSKTCKVHEMGMKCIQSNVGTQCSKDDTDFLYRNLHMIYPGIPSDCSDDVSASNLVQTSLSLLLISALLSLIL